MAKLLQDAEQAAEQGDYALAERQLGQASAYTDVTERRIALYLEWARARASKPTRGEAREAIEHLLALAPDHREGRKLKERIDALFGPPSELTLDLGNGVTMGLVLVPSGKFMMGSTVVPEEPPEHLTELDEDALARRFDNATVEAIKKIAKSVATPLDFFEDARPQHEVRITEPFYLGKHEVTQAQWRAVMGTDIRQQRHKNGREQPLRGEGGNYPMYYVSWEEAQAFCRELSDRLGCEIRLPTEAEWEYACRAGKTTAYCFGEHAGLLHTYAWYTDNSDDRTHPVAWKRPNSWGLCDMHGNVREWCADWYGPDYYAHCPRNDPPGPRTGDKRVLRGGAWFSFPSATSCRCAHRASRTPERRADDAGFRVAAGVSCAKTHRVGSVRDQAASGPAARFEERRLRVVRGWPGLTIYEQVADIDDFIPKPSEAPPVDWVELRYSPGPGPFIPVARIPRDGLREVTLPHPTSLDPSAAGFLRDVWFKWGRYILSYDAAPIDIKAQALHQLDYLMEYGEREIGEKVAPEVAQAVRERIESQDSLTLTWAALGLRASDRPRNQSSIEDAIYDYVLTKAQYPLAEVVREIFAGNRAVFRYGREDYLRFGVVTVVVYEDCQPLYEITAEIVVPSIRQAGKAGSEPAATEEYDQTFAHIARSIAECAVGADGPERGAP